MSIHEQSIGRVVVVTIDRPQVRNAVDRATAAALADAMRRFDASDTADVAVLTGAGANFCAGADLKEVRGPGGNRVALDGDGPMGPTRMALSKPVIAAIEGYAVAGGLELAIWCDLRVASSEAVFGVFCRRWGVPLIDGGTVRLPRLIGAGRALDLILTGREVRADEALAIGLVTQVVPPGEALTAAIALAERIAAHPQLCVRSDLQSTKASLGLSTDDALRVETELGQRTRAATQLADVQRFIDGAGRGGQPS